MINRFQHGITFRPVIHFAAPVNYSLAQIVLSFAADADTVYVALKRGTGFENLAKTFSIYFYRSQHGEKLHDARFENSVPLAGTASSDTNVGNPQTISRSPY